MPPGAPPTIASVLEAVALRFDVSAADILSASRARRVLPARHAAIYLAHCLTGETHAEIGARFGNRDRTNVQMIIRAVERRRAENTAQAIMIDDLSRSITGRNKRA